MDKKYLRVEGHSFLVRDVDTNAIVNTNIQGHKSYLELRRAKDRENRRIDNIESDINELKSDLSEIKHLLRKLANES